MLVYYFLILGISLVTLALPEGGVGFVRCFQCRGVVLGPESVERLHHLVGGRGEFEIVAVSEEGIDPVFSLSLTVADLRQELLGAGSGLGIDLAGQAVEPRLCHANAPQVKPGGKASGRDKYRAAWKAWWKEQGATVEFAQLDAGPLRKAKVRARASATEKDEVAPDKAFDLNQPTGWNAGGYAPQWIEADLGTPNRLANLRLAVNQSPDGMTTHEVWVSNTPIGDDRAKAKMVRTFNGHTQQLQHLKFDFPKGLAARYIQIRTTQSSSRVAWVAIEVQVGRTRSSFVTAGTK